MKTENTFNNQPFFNRLRQSLDVKDSSLEDLTSKLSTAERERGKLRRELDHHSGESSKIHELEQENRKMAQERSVDKRALVKLR